MPQRVITTIQGFLTPQHIAQRINVQQPIALSCRDWLFPVANHQQHPFSKIGVDQLTRICKNVPVVRPGTKAVNLNEGYRELTEIKPYGVDIVDNITAGEINEMNLLSNTSIETVINNKTDFMIKTVRLTSEALSAQAMTGTIDYPVKTEGGIDTMEIKFGDTNTYAPGKLWNAADIKIMEVYETLSDMQTVLENNGFGAKIEFKAGKDAFKYLLQVADGASNKVIKVRVMGNKIDVGGIEVVKEAGTYSGVNDMPTQKVPDNQIVAADVQAGHGFFWLALDDLKAGLVPLPFFPSHEVTNNPSQMEIVGRGKPLPAPIPKAFCWATVG